MKPIVVVTDAHEKKDAAQTLFLSEHKPAEALALLKEALALALAHKEVKDIHDIYIDTARILESTSQWSEAEQTLRTALVFDKAHFRPASSKLSDTKAQLGFILAQEGKYDEAEQLLLDAIKTREDASSWSMAVDHILKLIWLYEHEGDFQKAAQATQRMIEFETFSHGPDSPALKVMNESLKKLQARKTKVGA